jgi:hypothetical protein
MIVPTPAAAATSVQNYPYYPQPQIKKLLRKL